GGVVIRQSRSDGRCVSCGRLLPEELRAPAELSARGAAQAGIMRTASPPIPQSHQRRGSAPFGLFRQLAFTLLIVPVALIIWAFGLWENPRSRWCRLYAWLLGVRERQHGDGEKTEAAVPAGLAPESQR